jgi:hypothetical protein
MATNDAERMSAKRAAARDIILRAPADSGRRRACLANVYDFLRTYFPTVFYQPFTDSRSQMVDAIVSAAAQSGDQAIAGPRGDGKTRAALFTAFWLLMRDAVHFPLLISKSGKRAMDELKNLKWAIRESELFGLDFPEIGQPIEAMGGWASRARQMTVFGEPIDMEWAVDCIVLPTIPTDLIRANVRDWPADLESVATGQIFSSLGIEGPIRGYSVRNRRPDLAIIDDIDDRESAHSALQTDNRIEIIDADVAGLGGPDRNVSRVMLCTLINRTCAAFVFTDPKQRPSFRGQRHRLISKLPDNQALSEQYVVIRSGRDAEKDPEAREAHEWYRLHQAEIEAGHVSTNPYRYNQAPMSDGKPAELSSYQGYLNFVADKGLAAALTELQNDPPEDADGAKLILTAYHVRANCRSGLARGVVPSGAKLLTRGVDLKKTGLHHATVAWDDRLSGSIIDYDFWPFETQGLKASACEGIILEGLQEWWHAQKAGYLDADGSPWDVDLTLIDEGWKEDGWNTQPVEIFAKAAGWGLVLPSKGIPNWRPRAATKTSVEGSNFRVEWRFGFPLCEVNADHFKIRCHEGFLQPFGDAGSLGLFSPSQDQWGREPANAHHSYAKHITSERWAPAGTSGAFKWQPADGARFQKPNHWLDATALAIAAREIRGVSVVQPKQQDERPRTTPQPRKPRPTVVREQGERWLPQR